MFKLTSIAVAAATMLMALATAQAQAGIPRIAVFDVTVEGVQKVSWSAVHHAAFDCDVNIEGAGHESDRFRSLHPLQVTAIASGRQLSLVSRGGEPMLPVKIIADREGKITETSQHVCSEGDGTGTVAGPAPDCGRLTITDGVLLERDPAGRVILVPGPAMRDPFSACPSGPEGSWPRLVPLADAGRVIGRRLTAGDLFNHDETILLAGGTHHFLDPESPHTASIRWTLTFRKVHRRLN